MAKAKDKTVVSLLREFSVPLIGGIVVALVWANFWSGSYEKFVHGLWGGAEGVDLEFAVNEVFMAIFFGIAAVEITDSFAPGGSLNPPSKAIVPIMATFGGVLGPVGFYFLLNHFCGSAELVKGWGIGTATDIALAWLVARLVFGAGHAAISFLLLLAIGDDAIGLVIIAIFYPDPKHAIVFWPLLLVAAGVAIAWGLRRMKVENYWAYLLAGGVFSWTGLFLAHLHPALALVFVVPFMPHRRKKSQESVFDIPTEAKERDSTLIQFEHEWKVVVDFGLFFFGLANSGVAFSAVSTVTWLVLASLLVGKTVGIFGFGVAARLMGFKLMEGMTMRDLFLAGMIAGIGLTVALFVAGAAFTDSEHQGAAKMGALGTLGIVPLVFLVNVVWRGKRTE